VGNARTSKRHFKSANFRYLGVLINEHLERCRYPEKTVLSVPFPFLSGYCDTPCYSNKEGGSRYMEISDWIPRPLLREHDPYDQKWPKIVKLLFLGY
jgi:hypothetical protein